MASTNYIRCEKVVVNLAGIDLPCWVSVDNPEQRFLSGSNITDVIGEHHSSLARKMGVNSLKALSSKCFELRNIKVKPISKEGSPFDPVSIVIAYEYWARMSGTNDLALALVIACGVETLDRRIDTALGIKRSEEEYEQRTALKRKRIIARYSWTDQIKLRQEQQGYYRGSDGKITARATAEYRDLTIKVNQALIGQPHFNCDRDTMTLEQQVTIESFETFLACWAIKYKDKSATQLVEECLDLFALQAA